MNSLDDLLHTAKEAALAAAEVHRRSGAPEPEAWTEKGHSDWVSAVDESAEQAAVAEIRKRFPDHAIAAEELDWGGPAPGEAEDFRIYLRTDESLAENTVRRRCGIAKQFFRAAKQKKIIADNPFDGLPTTVRENSERWYFISRDEAQAVLDACPDAEWRLIFALCRHGGLRCPTEVLRLKWSDINWEHDRFTVHASKTEHHADAGLRQVPLFPELLPLLRDCFEEAEPGSEYVITRYREHNENLRTQMTKIIKRAGLTPWPKVFQNLRSTRETELAQEFPIHVVCKWIGNSPQVASRHYLQITEEHFAKAVQNPVQSASVSGSQELSAEPAGRTEVALVMPGQEDATHCNNNRLHELGVTGLEPVTSSV